MAFHITSGQNRFMGCYIDGSRSVFEGGGLKGNIWMNGFECCAGAPGPHGIELLGDTIGPGLIITHNLFRGGNIYWNGTTPTVTGSRIESNSFSGGGAGTRATLSLPGGGATTWVFDACKALVFPVIARVDVSVIAASGFPRLVARPPVGCTVQVDADAPVDGTVSVTVDSSTLSPEFV